MFRQILCLLATSLLFSLHASPLNDSEKEEQPFSFQHEVVVTATRLESPLKETASSITVIKREDLERSKKTILLEAINEVLGLTVIQSGALGSAASVQLRGANSEHTLVMLDGVELNDPMSPSRSCDLSHLTVESVERVEILRGPQSTLYGSDALAGVINIITRKGEGKPRLHALIHGGSYSTFHGQVGAFGSTDKLYYSTTVSSLRSGGFSAASTAYEGNKEPDGYRNLTLSARFGFRPSHQLDIDCSIRSINTKTDIDNFGGDFGDDPNSKQSYDALFFRGHVRGLFFQNRWEQKMVISFVNYDRGYDNPTDSLDPTTSEKAHYKSHQWKLDWQHNFFLHSSNTLTLGLEYRLEQGQSEYYSESLWGLVSSLFPIKRAYNAGLYIQEQMSVDNQLFVTAGVRFSMHSLAGSATTFRIASTFLIEETKTKIKGTLGTGFKSPSLYQLFAPASAWGPIGKEDLSPEKSVSWDAGIEQNFLEDRISVGITIFDSRFDNLIDFDFSRGYVNIRKARSWGAEFTAHARPLKNLLLEASFALTEAKDSETGEYLLRRPRNKFTAKLDYALLDKGSIILSLVHIGKREDMVYTGWVPERVTMSSYTLLNTAVSYDITRNIQAFIRIDNILDEDYEVIGGYGTPGISVYAGFKLSL